MPFYHLINLLIVLLFSGLNTRHADQRTEVSIKDESFYINDLITYPDRYWEGYKIEGLLFNSRMVQGIFDDLNPATANLWKYADTQKWDPDRNTNEFVAAMTGWYAHGLLSFTINLQGGSPMGYGNRDWYNSAYFEDGRLRPEYMARLKKILDKADTLGMVPIVGLFYFGQDQHLADDSAVIRGATNVIEWLHSEGYKNILIEVANECDNNKYDRNILKADRIHELITLNQRDSKKWIPVPGQHQLQRWQHSGRKRGPDRRFYLTARKRRSQTGRAHRDGQKDQRSKRFQTYAHPV